MMRIDCSTILQGTASKKGSTIMAKYKDQVSEATEELSESVRETNRVIAESAVAAQERNWKFAQSIYEDEVELFKSHAEDTRTVMEKLMGASEKGQPLFQSVAESMVAAQEPRRGHSHIDAHPHRAITQATGGVRGARTWNVGCL